MLMGLALAASGCSKGDPKNGSATPLDPPPKAISHPGDVVTYHNDVGRTGRNPNETILTPLNVNASNFGMLRILPVDGAVDAQPLYLSDVVVAGSAHNILFVATENSSVYAFDADSGAQLWKQSVLLQGEVASDARDCDQITPTIGITLTPVIDRGIGNHGAIFVVAMSKNPAMAPPTYYQRLHALDVTTGAELRSPATITANVPSSASNGANGEVTFDAAQYKERAALLLTDGVIYTTWASHCDFDPYTGWIIAYSELTLEQVAVLNVTPNGERGAIWMAGAGPAADDSGAIYIADSNGTFDTKLDAKGFPSRGDFGNAFLKLSMTGRKLEVVDYFTTWNTEKESNLDLDFGSGGVLILPDMKDEAGNVRHLAVGTGKDSAIYVVDRDAMGKFNSSGNQIYQELRGAVTGGAYSSPAYFNGSVYYGTVDDSLKAFPIRNARVATSPASKTQITFGYPGTTPSVSANGVSNGIVWAVENGNPSVLRSHDAANLGKELYNSNQAPNGRDHFASNRFVTPLIANGKVFVGARRGVVVFGLRSAKTAQQ